MSLNEETTYWAAWSHLSCLGPVRFAKILQHFGSLKTAWQAGYQDLLSSGLPLKIVEVIVAKRKELDPYGLAKELEQKSIGIITINEKDYPNLLKEIYGAPPVLYYLGQNDLKKNFQLAVVGSRMTNDYGYQVTSDLAYQLAQSGLSIVSGLALGIDGLAHQAALKAKGKTVAVLGSALDQIYPKSNSRLANEIIVNGGTIISEFPLGTIAYKSNFPLRNRIIAGLSLGVLVTQAKIKSGALITAKYALEQGREVFAVPGSIYNPLAQGSNWLIANGAKMVITAQDVLETLNLKEAVHYQQALDLMPSDDNENLLWPYLSREPIHIDKLVQSARLDISTVNATLIIMEMKGLVKNLGGQKFIRSR